MHLQGLARNRGASIPFIGDLLRRGANAGDIETGLGEPRKLQSGQGSEKDGATHDGEYDSGSEEVPWFQDQIDRYLCSCSANKGDDAG
jgi:hypothetical protein